MLLYPREKQATIHPLDHGDIETVCLEEGRAYRGNPAYALERRQAIEPFTILALYGVLVCTLCWRACVANEAKTHLASQYAVQVNIGRRKAIFAAIAAGPVRCRIQTDLDSFPLPTKPILAISPLEGPFPDGLGCHECPYIARQVRTIQEHCRTAHGWTNPVTRGGNVREKAARLYDLPWDSGVACQRFFSNRGACGWFRVEAPVRPAPTAATAALYTDNGWYVSPQWTTNI
ncbi:hypothetical protein MMYC01_209339 [Madurella mycetomatis]|uniref:Uncharacterized protein n=1 Tax=Madurella mycetomatis TaxID=100816 RepID=A0A175VT95_9PEZI|nr:hypothetical protein MMYC01_209339 [Madurella mycetomatis]